MKTPLAAALAGLALIAAAPAFAQAAATLPNSFDGPGAAQAQPTAPQPIAPLPAASTPVNPRSEATLRALIAEFAAGEPDYHRFTPNLAEQVQAQASAITPLIQGFGALQSVTFVGREGGADLFLAAFAEQRTQWIIGFEGDKVAALLFRPAPEE